MGSFVMELLASLPKGDALAEPAWNSRHGGILSILWLHVLSVPMFGIYMGASPTLPHRLRQILANLVGNAIKFTEEGNVAVFVRPDEGDQKRVRIEVTDTGIGIPLHAQEKIFDSFSQADGSMTRKYGGTGLGLAIVKQLVGVMGGRLSLTSTPGQGTTFWFTMALDRSSSSDMMSQPHSTDETSLTMSIRQQPGN